MATESLPPITNQPSKPSLLKKWWVWVGGALILCGLLALVVFSSNQLNKGWSAYASCNNGTVQHPLAVDHHGTVWTICFGGGGQYRLEPDRGSLISLPRGHDAHQMAFAPDDRVWVVDGSNIHTWDVNGQGETYAPETVDGHPLKIDIDGQGRAWLMRWGGGLGMIDPTSKVTTYTLRIDGITDFSVSSATIDRQGRVWVVTSSEVKFLDFDGNWTTHATGAPRGESLAVDTQGRVWVSNGPDREGVRILGADGMWTTYSANDPQSPQIGVVTAIVPDEQGRVWVGSRLGLHRLDNDGSWTTYTSGNSKLANTSVADLAVDGEGRLWMSGDDGITILDPNLALSRQDYQLFSGLQIASGISAMILGFVGAMGFLSIRAKRAPTLVPVAETITPETVTPETVLAKTPSPLTAEIEFYSNQGVRVTNQQLIVPPHTWPIAMFQPVRVEGEPGKYTIELIGHNRERVHTLHSDNEQRIQLIAEAINHALEKAVVKLVIPFWGDQKAKFKSLLGMFGLAIGLCFIPVLSSTVGGYVLAFPVVVIPAVIFSFPLGLHFLFNSRNTDLTLLMWLLYLGISMVILVSDKKNVVRILLGVLGALLSLNVVGNFQMMAPYW